MQIEISKESIIRWVKSGAFGIIFYLVVSNIIAYFVTRSAMESAVGAQPKDTVGYKERSDIDTDRRSQELSFCQKGCGDYLAEAVWRGTDFTCRCMGPSDDVPAREPNAPGH